jgi:hypothetical protein
MGKTSHHSIKMAMNFIKNYCLDFIMDVRHKKVQDSTFLDVCTVKTQQHNNSATTEHTVASFESSDFTLKNLTLWSKMVTDFHTHEFN